MHSRTIWRAAAVVASVTAALGGATLASAATGQPNGGHHSGGIKHVLLISVDGMHQQDLAWYVQNYPHSVLAALEDRGVEYSNAQTPFPSDSTPGMVAQVTGGDPRVDRLVLRRHVEPRRIPGGHDELLRTRARRRGRLRGGHRQEPDPAGRGRRPRGPARQHLADDQQSAGRDQPGRAAGRPDDLQADLPEPVPAGQHDLQRGHAARAPHRLVRQAPRLPDVLRAFGKGRHRLLHARDQQRGEHRDGWGLDQRQRLDHAV